MKPATKGYVLTSSLVSIFFMLAIVGTASPPRITSGATSSITVSPGAGIVGTGIIVTGQGYPPNTSLILNWGTDNVSWTFGGNPTETTGIHAVPVQWKLANVQTNASGYFSAQVAAPVDNGGKHLIQVYGSNGSALPGGNIFTLEPSFKISSFSGPAGSPITIFATGLGIGVYSTNYHVMWDNKYFGYMTAVTTRGSANATIYAVGTLGTHYIDIYQGYPGAAYLNPDQNPSSGNWFPPYLPYQTTFTITSEPYSQTSTWYKCRRTFNNSSHCFARGGGRCIRINPPYGSAEKEWLQCACNRKSCYHFSNSCNPCGRSSNLCRVH